MALALGTGAQINTSCPQCLARPGEPCRQPRGRISPMSHGVRVQKYIKEDPQAMGKATLKAYSFEEWVTEVVKEMK